jgi:probable O-glycosylation ligase (exosortase A-associated)
MSITALLFLAVFAAGSIAALRRPFYGILVYIFVYFMNPVARWWYQDLPDLRFSFTVGIFLLVGYFANSREFRRNNILQVPQFRWLITMTVLVLVASLWSVRVDIHLELLSRYCKFILFALLLYKIVDTADKIEKVLAVYLMGIFYISWYGWQLGRTGEGRLEGIGGPDCLQANETAAVLVTAIPLLIFFFLYGRNKWIKGSATVGLIFVLNCLILINSRGSILSLLIAVPYFLYFVLKENKDARVRWKVTVGVIFCVIAFLYLTDASFWERMQTIEMEDASKSSGHRTDFWLMTFDMLADHPLGMGARGYEFMSPYYLPHEWLSEGFRAVHSLWFEVLSEYGYQGLTVFVCYVVSTFLQLHRVRRFLRQNRQDYEQLQSVAIEASFLAFLAAATFGNSFYREILYWLPAIVASFANVHMVIPLKKEVVAEVTPAAQCEAFAPTVSYRSSDA